MPPELYRLSPSAPLKYQTLWHFLAKFFVELQVAEWVRASAISHSEWTVPGLNSGSAE